MGLALCLPGDTVPAGHLENSYSCGRLPIFKSREVVATIAPSVAKWRRRCPSAPDRGDMQGQGKEKLNAAEGDAAVHYCSW